MKKLIALIACISVFACMSVSALAAAPTGSVEDISYTEATESASGYFTIDASDVATGNTQTTIVVIDGVGTSDENGVKNYNISTSTIQYINQQDNASFTVIPKDHDTYLEGATEKTLTVLIGGDNINRTELGTITYAAAEAPVTKYTVTFKNGDAVLTTAQYDEGTTGVTYSGETPTKADDETYTYTFAGWLDSETQADVDLATLTVTKDITLIAKFTATEKEVGGGDVETTTYKIGDADLSGDIGSADLTALRAYLKLNKNSSTKYHINEDLPYTAGNTTYKIGDADLSNDIGSADLTALRAYLKLNKNSSTKYHINEDVTVDK